MSTASTIAQYASIATPVAGTLAAGAVAYVAKLVGQGRFVKIVDDIEKDAPAVEAVLRDAEKVPAVKTAVTGVEDAAKAEVVKLNTATHGAIDVLANQLAKTVPQAIQDAIVAAHAAVSVASVPAAAPVVAPAQRVDVVQQ